MRERVCTIVAFALAGLLSGLAEAAETADERCRRTLDRMVSAQSSRLIKELKKCSRRNPGAAAFESECTAFIGDDDNLHAAEDVMNRGLTRVERHGDDKFPRKCAGASSELFEPACFEVVDAEVQFRRCVYNDHTLALLLDLLAITKNLDVGCRTLTIDVARRAWRDWIRDDDDRMLERGPTRLRRLCDDETEHWAAVRDAIESQSSTLRQMVIAD